MNEQAVYNPNWKQDERRRKIRDWFFWNINMNFKKVFWGTLFFLHLATIVGRLMCRLNIYSKFGLSGRCQYCGEVHGMHWKIKLPDYGGLEGLK